MTDFSNRVNNLFPLFLLVAFATGYLLEEVLDSCTPQKPCKSQLFFALLSFARLSSEAHDYSTARWVPVRRLFWPPV